MSRELHLITRQRPTAADLAEALADVAGVSIQGNFDDPDAYLNVSSPEVWIELEAPGHVEAGDLRESYEDNVILPLPDDDQCLWLTTASIPLGAPPDSHDTACQSLAKLAARREGIAIEP